jgi:farnesyl diphosphate synthase
MFTDRLGAAGRRIQAHFDVVLAGFDDIPVTQGMRYATKGGKRLRGFLVLESARLYRIGTRSAIWPAAAIEAMHAYSLVHDDMPCMDNDDLRRGRPTVHVKWDDGTALLVGDALQSLAFELASHPDCGPAEVRATLALALARASGAQGMVLGQALDIAAESADIPLGLAEITALQAGKTGALIEWAACAGARLAKEDPAPLSRYARALGLAFQISDDILDVEGDATKAGKRLKKDARAGKATYVSLLGLEGAKSRASDLVDQACAALSVYGQAGDPLRAAARFVISRER